MFKKLVSLLWLGLFLGAFVPAHSLAQDEFDDDFEDRQVEQQQAQERGSAETERQRTAGESSSFEEDGFSDDGIAENRFVDDVSVRDPEANPSDASGEPSGLTRRDRLVLHNSYGGSVGGIRIVDAGSGPSESFRVQLLGEFFQQGGFLELGDENQRIGGSLSLSWTPFSFLEFYGSIISYANSNKAEKPGLFQVLGDSAVGVKAFAEPLSWLRLGGDVSVHVLNVVGNIGWENFNFSLRANATADLRALENNRIPLLARLNLEYEFDNSEGLINKTEQARYNALPDPRTYREESRHLISRVERFALGINRTDFFRIGVGLEAPVDVTSDFTISPMVEWLLSVPVNRNGYSCLYVSTDGGNTGKVGYTDGCLDRQGFESFPQTLTLGMRVLPPVKGLGILVGLDIGLTGMSTNVRELAATQPYNFMFALSYAYDTFVPPPVLVEAPKEEDTTQVAKTGHIRGTVVEQGAGTAVAHATVLYAGTELTGQTTNAAGQFVSYELAPGEHRLELSHPDYESGSCAATIAEAGGDADLRCELVAKPKNGDLKAQLVSDAGTPVSGATVHVQGPLNASGTQGPTTLTTDASGNLVAANLAPGTYTAKVDVEGYLLGAYTFEIRAKETASPAMVLVKKPSRPLVSLRAREIVIMRQVQFATDSAEILPESTPLLTAVADVLLRNPEITRVEIQGHTDNRGGSDHNKDLSERRAQSVLQWLIQAGIEATRLESKGFGDTRPLAPNITSRNRARNRRVQFMILDRQ